MVVPLISPYFRWLQQGNPVGEVERYPELDSKGQTSVPGLYVVGDLTGIPLLKLAVEDGRKRIKILGADPAFQLARKTRGDAYDILIIGGGPSGVAAALECQRQGLKHLLLESSALFQTIENFPKGKPILAKPDDRELDQTLPIRDGSKESLLEDLHAAIVGQQFEMRKGIRVERIRKSGEFIRVETASGEKWEALRVILAIGKSGDARRLNVPGENKPHVSNRLFDPGEFSNKDILVVGGGDSALESAVALAQAGNRVALSYRKESLDRPKAENLAAFEHYVSSGTIKPFFSSTVMAIDDATVRLKIGSSEKEIPAQNVFVLIGRELPLNFFRRSGIRMEGQKDKAYWVFLTAMISFFVMLYCGKAGVDRNVFAGSHGFLDHIQAYLSVPFQGGLQFAWKGAAWNGALNFLLGWLGSLVFIGSGLGALGILISRHAQYFGTGWNRVKYGYFIVVALGFSWVYLKYCLGQEAGWSEGPTYWYSFFYSTTIMLFGIRRMIVRPTRYIRLQTASLILFQVFFLFLLPFHLFEPLVKPLFDPNGYVMREIFPSGKWSCFGFVLFWPLNMGDFGRTNFWTWFPLLQTFGILFLLVKKFGKGAYCGWICSCGGLSETLGDEYRQKTPHGKTPKRLENIGQFVLAFALIATVLSYVSKHSGPSFMGDLVKGLYKITIDVGFAGVAGLGFYFFLGGRVWCRFGCPLAAIMHIYTRISTYRIFAEKKKCISCNICTKVCHMGIDVMNYANKGIPMNDVECVRCSACVQNCPTETLSFGSINKVDLANISRQEKPDYGKKDWKAGIR